MNKVKSFSEKQENFNTNNVNTRNLKEKFKKKIEYKEKINE